MISSKEWVRVSWLFLLSVLMLAPVGAGAGGRLNGLENPQASITFVQPDGVDDQVGEGQDFATLELGDPWDMDQPSDIWLSRNMSNERFENGAYKATTSSSNNSYFYLLWQGYPHAQNIGKTGQAHPINASQYHRVAVALCSTQAGNMWFYWYYGVGTSNYKLSNMTTVHAGCNVYVYDLLDSLVGRGDWTGNINGFRLDPKVNGGDIEVHWVRLTDDPTAAERYEIAWSGLTPSGTGHVLRLYVDSGKSNDRDWWLYSQVSPPQSGSYQWGYTGLPGVCPLAEAPTVVDLEAGDYYLYATVDDSAAGHSAGPLIVNQAPQLWFTSPSFTSGPDFATEINKDPWDMSDPDVAAFRNIVDYYYSNGRLYLVNTNWDPGLEMFVNAPIDSRKYRYLTVVAYLDRPRNVDEGTVARAFWYNSYANVATIENIILSQGWQTYSLDLTEALLVSGSPPWTSANWANFRYDPNENVTGEVWHNTIIDEIKLTGMPEATDHFIIEWEIDNPEDEGMILSLYYDTNDSGFDGVLIGQTPMGAAPEPAPSGEYGGIQPQLDYQYYFPIISRNLCVGECLVWTTSQLPSGEYYIYGCIDDGVNQLCRYGDVPVLVK